MCYGGSSQNQPDEERLPVAGTQWGFSDVLDPLETNASEVLHRAATRQPSKDKPSLSRHAHLSVCVAGGPDNLVAKGRGGGGGGTTRMAASSSLLLPSPSSFMPAYDSAPARCEAGIPQAPSMKNRWDFTEVTPLLARAGRRVAGG